MTKLTGQEMPWPLVETSWLADHLEDPDLRILDCSVMMEITDRGDRKYSSGRAAWKARTVNLRTPDVRGVL